MKIILLIVIVLSSFFMHSLVFAGKTASEGKLKPLAEQGDASAPYKLGRMYYYGDGVAHDYIEAHKWFNIAGANGLQEAIGTRDSVARRMTPEQIAEAQRLANEWMAAHNK